MSKSRGSSAAWVQGILDMLASEGLPVERLCHDAGIDMESLRCSQTRIDVDRISRIWELAVRYSGCPTLGLDRQLALRFGKIDLVAYSMSSSPNLITGLQGLSRHAAVISDATIVSLEHDARGHWLSIRLIGASRPVPRQRVEFAVLVVLALCSWLARREIKPLAVEFSSPAPHVESRAIYIAAFGLLPQFGREVNRILLGQSDLDLQIPTHNPELLALHEKIVETEFDSLGHTRIGTRVCREIMRLLPQGEPRRESVAQLLNLTERTLQRRLRAESTTYQQLLDGTRRELALQYLMDTRLSLGEIAYLLGFADQSNLFRACRRWFGMPPGIYRQQILK